MFLLRFIQFLLGSVYFSADGGFPEKFLNLAARNEIMLWNIRRRGSGISARTLAKNFRRLRPLAAQAGVRLEVLRLSGLPFKIKKYGKRKGLFAGILLFFVLLFFFSSFVWTVNVTGNRTVSSEEITQELSKLGVRPGAFPLLINVREVERQALIDMPDLSWIAVNITGSTANVKVRERKYPPDVVPEDYPCNVKASQTAQIIDLQVFEGTAALRDGDTVTKGGLLISGVVTDKNGTVRFVHASGKAIARTRRELSVTVAYHQKIKMPVGKPEVKNLLHLFNLSVPLYFTTPGGDCQITAQTNSLKIFGLQLPFSITVRSYQRLKLTQVVYTKSQAAAQAEKQMERLEKTELSGVKILSTAFESKSDQNGYTLIRNYSCEEDIAYQEEIPLS